MGNQYTTIVLVSCLFDVVSADRYEALEDAEPYDYGSSSTSTSSRSFYKTSGFIISWLLAIFVLRALVLVAGKMIVWLSEIFVKLKEHVFPADVPGRRKVKRRRASVNSYVSLGSVSSQGFVAFVLTLKDF